MRRIVQLTILIGILLAATPAHAQTVAAIRGWCEDGGQHVKTSGVNSTSFVQLSIPSCTVSVRLHAGGATTIYRDSSLTPLANPFTAQTNGQWIFYVSVAANIDVVMTFPSSPGVGPVTLFDIAPAGGGGSGGGVCGPPTSLQSNQSGSCYGDLGLTYLPATQSLSGLSGLLITPTTAADLPAPIVTPNATAATGYTYTIIAYKGNVPIAISAPTTITNGPTTIDSGHTVGLAWSAVLGADRYIALRQEFPFGTTIPSEADSPVRGTVCTVAPPTVACTDNLTNATGPQYQPWLASGGTGITNPLVLGDPFYNGPRSWSGDDTTTGPSLQVYQSSRGAPGIFALVTNESSAGEFDNFVTVTGAGAYSGNSANSIYFGSGALTGNLAGSAATAGNLGTGSVNQAWAFSGYINNEGGGGTVGESAVYNADVPLILAPNTAASTAIHSGFRVADQSTNGVLSYQFHSLTMSNTSAGHFAIKVDNGTSEFDGPVVMTAGCTGCGGAGGTTFQTNTVANANQGTLNLLNSAATNGITLTLTNTSAGNVQLGLTGTLTSAGGGTSVTDFTFSGSTHKALTLTGTLTSGDLLSADGSSNAMDSGLSAAAVVTSTTLTTARVPVASGAHSLSAGFPVVGTDANLPTSDGLTGGTGKVACQDANGGLTTTVAICGSATVTPLVSVTTSAQTGSLGSTTVVASTSADGFWAHSATINVTAQSGSPTVVVTYNAPGGGTCPSAAQFISGTGTFFFTFPSSAGVECVTPFFAAGSAINVSTTVVLGGGSITYTLTAKAKLVD